MEHAMSIVIPPKTKAKLTELVIERNRLNSQIDGIIDIARETMNVPDNWQLYDIDAGFTPPGEIADADDPNHE